MGKKPAKKTPSNAKNASTSTPITPGNSGIVKNANGSTTVWTEKGSFTYKNDQALTTSGEVITGAAVVGTAGIAWEGLSTAAIALYTKAVNALNKYGETATKEGVGKAELTQSKVDEILSMERGTRPDPSTYLSKDYIGNHLAEFDGGVTKISANAPSGVVGPPGGTFVMPKSVADALIKESGGDVAKLEELLSLEPGTLGSNPVRIDIASPNGLRMPSGNELGANSQWIPGGYTGGGISEATIDPATPGTYTVTHIK